MSDAWQTPAGPRLAEAARPAFARHETFHPRFGWLGKGYAAAAADPGVFTDEAATSILGVGKNQVRAIRYWMAAFKLTDEQGPGRTVPTWEANWLLSEDGADPYLEEQGSLWLLHWRLLSPECRAPTWWITFNTWNSARFHPQDLAQHVARQAVQAGWQQPAANSVERDIDCLTRMYSRAIPADRSSADFEDYLNSPFRELALLDRAPAGRDGGGRQWRFSSPDPAMIPGPVVTWACLDYAGRDARGRGGAVSLSRLAREPGSPGRAFLLGEETLTSLLEQTAAEHPGVAVAHSAAGQPLLVFSSDPRALAWDILDAHYGGARSRVATRAEWAARFPAPAPRPRPVPVTRGRNVPSRSQGTLFDVGAAGRPRRLRGTGRGLLTARPGCERASSRRRPACPRMPCSVSRPVQGDGAEASDVRFSKWIWTPGLVTVQFCLADSVCAGPPTQPGPGAAG